MNQDWFNHIPHPVFDEHPEYVELYNLAWNLAKDHVKHIPGMPQDPYIDESFCESRIWIWDTCFMTLFCKFSPKDFPGIESFRNLIDVLQNGVRLPLVRIPEGEPAWTGNKPGDLAPILIQHPDNPPLFAWAEYENALMSGNREHLKDILQNTKVLQKHYNWLESLKESVLPDQCMIPTRWIHHEKGYFWGGTPSGMDNTPRGRFSHTDTGPELKDFYWVDAIAQQALTAECIVRMAEIIGDDALAAEWAAHKKEKQELIQKYYWDPVDGFFYDIDPETMKPLRIVTPASFWVLLAGCATPEQAKLCAEKLLDPELLGGKYPWVTVARNDAKFNADNGLYWHGAVWVPTAYAGTRALLRYGMFDLAREKVLDMLKHMYDTWKNFSPHTIWECYSPNKPEPAHTTNGDKLVRPNFCGWSALMPIAGLIENAIGLYEANAFTNTLCWHLSAEAKGKTGCRNYRFGEIITDLIAENGVCSYTANKEFNLEINGTMHRVPAGSGAFRI